MDQEETMAGVPRLKITERARNAAYQALKERSKLPPSKRYGLTAAEAKAQGVESGVQRAWQLINEPSLSLEDAKSMAGFYKRFANCRTENCEGALGLWGGRWFLRYNVLPYVRRYG